MNNFSLNFITIQCLSNNQSEDNQIQKQNDNEDYFDQSQEAYELVGESQQQENQQDGKEQLQQISSIISKEKEQSNDIENLQQLLQNNGINNNLIDEKSLQTISHVQNQNLLKRSRQGTNNEFQNANNGSKRIKLCQSFGDQSIQLNNQIMINSPKQSNNSIEFKYLDKNNLSIDIQKQEIKKQKNKSKKAQNKQKSQFKSNKHSKNSKKGQKKKPLSGIYLIDLDMQNFQQKINQDTEYSQFVKQNKKKIQKFNKYILQKKKPKSKCKMSKQEMQKQLKQGRLNQQTQEKDEYIRIMFYQILKNYQKIKQKMSKQQFDQKYGKQYRLFKEIQKKSKQDNRLYRNFTNQVIKNFSRIIPRRIKRHLYHNKTYQKFNFQKFNKQLKDYNLNSLEQLIKLIFVTRFFFQSSEIQSDVLDIESLLWEVEISDAVNKEIMRFFINNQLKYFVVATFLGIKINKKFAPFKRTKEFNQFIDQCYQKIIKFRIHEKILNSEYKEFIQKYIKNQ